MVDVLIENDVEADFHRKIAFRHVVWTDPNTCYVFYVEATANDLEYRKSIDRGLTWTAGATPIIIRTGSIKRFDIWYEKWTNNDTGTLIHIVSLDSSTGNVEYINLDTSDDSLDAPVIIANDSTSTAAFRSSAAIGITKARGNGFLYVQYWTRSLDHAFLQSDDVGATWNVMADGADGDAVDEIQLIYGNESDTDDIWMIYWDRSAEEISLKIFDFSGNAWSETLISAGMVDNPSALGMKVTMRHSDDHAILVAWNAFDAATADLKAWDIGGSASITALTDVLTDSAESYYPCIMTNQQNDDLYVGYLRGASLGALMGAYYKLSTDGGSTWDAEVSLSDDADDDLRYIDAGISVGNDGGRFQPAWFNDDLDDLFTNVDNGVEIEAAVDPTPVAADLPEYGQVRIAIGDPPVFGATIMRS